MIHGKAGIYTASIIAVSGDDLTIEYILMVHSTDKEYTVQIEDYDDVINIYADFQKKLEPEVPYSNALIAAVEDHVADWESIEEFIAETQ